jgi:hypothetical protein
MIKYTNIPSGSGLSLPNEHVVRKTHQTQRKATLAFLKALCNHLIKRPDPMIVPIYRFRDLGFKKGHYHYCYDMMRCGIISIEERLIVDDVAAAQSLNRTNPTNNFCHDASSTPEYAREQFPKLMSFLDEVVRLDRYNDLHGHNVMRNQDGDLCLIDLEGFAKTAFVPLDSPENSWIIR